MMNIIGARLSPESRASNETRDIYLPNQTEQVSQIAIDVSGAIVLNSEQALSQQIFILYLSKLGIFLLTKFHTTNIRLEAR
jgi:hypothetical protein